MHIPDRTRSPWMWFVDELQRAQPSDPVPVDGSRGELLAWQRRARRRLTKLLGPSMPFRELDLVTEASEDCGSYVRHRVRYRGAGPSEITAWLLVPHRASRGGVLALHGHGAGADEVVGLASTEDRGDPYAHTIAELGFVVLAPDQRGFGARADWQPDGIYHCDYELTLATLLGTSPLAISIAEARRGLDVLSLHASQLGIAGLSFGGTVSLFTAALDRRVRAAIVSGYFSSWAACASVPWNMCGSQVLPGIVRELDHVDLAALIAPRSLLIQTGRTDGIFPQETAVAEHARLARVFHTLGGDTVLDAFDGGHAWSPTHVAEILAPLH